MDARFGVLRPQRCRYCDRPLNRLEQISGGVCRAAACRGRSLENELIDFRERALRSLGEPAAAFPIVVVPHRRSRVVPMEPERRSAFEAHVRELADAAAKLAEGADADAMPQGDRQDAGTDATERTGRAVCGACQGFCCYPGAANAAFIDAQTLKAYALAHPEAKADEIVAAYMSRVPDQHFEESCVYHAASGCSLPRPMRSTICNEYACKGLSDALAVEGEGGTGRHFVVARHDNRIARGVLIDAAGSREVSKLCGLAPTSERADEPD